MYMMQLSSRSTLFPYTTLFRSCRNLGGFETGERKVGAGVERPVTALAQAQPVPAGASDHRGIVGIKAGTGHRHAPFPRQALGRDRKSTRLNSSHTVISYAVFCL